MIVLLHPIFKSVTSAKAWHTIVPYTWRIAAQTNGVTLTLGEHASQNVQSTLSIYVKSLNYPNELKLGSWKEERKSQGCGKRGWEAEGRRGEVLIFKMSKSNTILTPGQTKPLSLVSFASCPHKIHETVKVSLVYKPSKHCMCHKVDSRINAKWS